MITHYFKLAQKILRKNGYYTIINVFGLICGTLAALIIANYIGSSLAEDQFHEHKDRIYAIAQEESINNNPEKKSNTSYWGLGALLQQYPEVIQVTRTSFHVGSLIKSADQNGSAQTLIENKIQSADSNFLKIFTFPLIYGDANTALAESNTMVITKTAASKYFGDTNPIGQSLIVRLPWGREDSYKVTGVLEDLPTNSRFDFNFLLSYPPAQQDGYWDFPSHETYAYLDQNAAIDEVVNKTNVALTKESKLTLVDKKVAVSLAPVGSAKLSDTEYLLVMIGIFILLISWVNYFNQIIAQSYARRKQIGVLKILGANRIHIKMQFAAESTLICLSALLLSILIYLGIEPLLQSFTGDHLLPMRATLSSVNLLFLSIFILGTALAASLPMMIFTSQKSGAAIRSIQWAKVGNIGLRKALVIFQFTLSTIMMIGIFVIGNQLDYMDQKDKGMSMENVLIVKAPILGKTNWKERLENLELFKQKCQGLPFVMETTSSTTIASETYRNEVYLSVQDSKDKILVHQNGVDERYFDLYDVAFIAGNNFFSETRFKNSKSIILNESAARNLGIYDFDQSIDTQIIDEESKEVYNLVGIVKDYHKTSLKYEIGPTAFKYNRLRGHISLKINAASLAANQFENQVKSIQQIWEQVYQDAAFNYFFLDKQFAVQDAEDRNFGILFKCFTVLSIIISCLGLFSLSLFISIKRQKEIGVRKVFGASVREILFLFYKSYISSLLISIMIGAPLAYFLMKEWLQNYAYRTVIGIQTMGMALMSLLLIFLVTVSFHVIKSSISNPVKILKDQ